MGFHFHSLPHGLILDFLRACHLEGSVLSLEEHFLSQRLDLKQRKGFLRSRDLPPSLEESEVQRGAQLEDEEMNQMECWESRAPASIYTVLEARDMSLPWS